MVSPLFPLTLTGALASRHQKRLIGPIDLSVAGQGTDVIIGPNGAGKTTLLRLIHGAARLSGGSLRWACPMDQARGRQAFVFQTPIMLRRSVEDNLIYPLRLRGVPRAQAKKAAAQWADRVGVGALLTRPAAVLSGGEKQKTAIARALITDPDVLFLDEPTTALDGKATREIEALLADAKARGTKLILSTHDMGQAQRIADRVVFLLDGRVHEQGEAPAFFAAPQTKAAAAFLRGDIVE